MNFRHFFPFFVSVVLSLTFIAKAQTNKEAELKDRLAQDIIDHLTPEMQVYYEKQKELYKKNHPVTPFIRHKNYTAFKDSGTNASSRDITRVLILVNETLYSNQEAKGKIDRYCMDIGNAFNCTVEVEVTEGGEPSDIRSLIKEYYDNGGLDGVTIIGDQPVQWYDIKDPRFDPGSFACDLYYMDLDGSWEDINSQDEYTWHVDGNGDVEPEIFCARIHLSSMSDFGNEVELLSTYLDKDHEYWIGNMELPQKGAAFVQETWAGMTNTVHYLYGDNNSDLFESQSNANSTAYINNGLEEDYSFIQLWCHSSIHGHSFDWGGSINDQQLYDIESNPIGYGIDACHIGAWPEGNGSYISGSYVFGKSKRALTILSGTRSGQSIGWEGKIFFEELGENICFGKAFIDWLGDYFIKAKGSNDYVDDRETKAWHYGYVIIGDPMVCFKEIPTAIEQDNTFSYKHDFSCKLTNRNIIKISYTLPSARFVSLKLHTMAGRSVAMLVNGFQNKGRHCINFRTSNIADGLYIMGLDAGLYAISKKVRLVH